jgi:type VI protein secretion system component Hcp
MTAMIIRTLTRRLTYANVVSTVCLFMVLGGSAYAAVSITGKDVKNGSLTSADIKDHSLQGRDFKTGHLPHGPIGPKGDTGPIGPKGDAGRAGPQGDPSSAGGPPAQSRKPVGRLTLPGITGDGPGGTIEVRSLIWSNELSGDPFSVGGGATPKAVWGDLVIAKAPDRSSAQLWKLTATGQHLASAKLELLAPGASAPYASYVFKDVAATTFSTHGSGDERQDEVGLSFTAPASPLAFAFDASAPLPALAQPRVGQLSVDGIPGAIDLVLDAWRLTNTGTARFGPFVVSKGVDGASSALLSRFASGLHTKKVTIKLLQPGSDTVYTTYVLTDAVVSSLAVIGDGRPLERIGFNAAKIESTTPVPAGAPIHSCFDRLLNAGC